MWLNKESVLNKVREEELYWFYFKIDVNKRNGCKSIIRSDDLYPSFRFKKDKQGRIKWSDFGSTSLMKDIFDLLNLIKGWTFYESLVHINNDFKLGFTANDKYNIDINVNIPVEDNRHIDTLQENSEKVIDVVLNKYNGQHIFTKDDFKYWNQGYITKQILQKELVFSVAIVLLNGIPIWHYHKKNPIYLYYEISSNGKYIKLYRPLNLNKSYKWLSNIKDAKSCIGGMNDLQDTDYVIITKSKKDYMVMKNVLGFNTIYVQSESTGISEYIIDILHKDYKTVYNLFDNDTAGYKLGEEFAKINNTIPIWYNKAHGKDTWDVIIKYGIEKNKEIINKLII